VIADVTGPNHVLLKTSNVAELVIYLSPSRFDLVKKVEIRIGNRTIEHQPKPSVNRLIASYRDFRDSGRLFADRLIVRPAG